MNYMDMQVHCSDAVCVHCHMDLLGRGRGGVLHMRCHQVWATVQAHRGLVHWNVCQDVHL